MIKFLLSIVSTAALLPFFIRWGVAQTDKQLDKMQEDAFDTPGADSPITPPVVLGTLGIIVGHFVAGGSLFGLRFWQSIFSLLFGSLGAVGLFMVWFRAKKNSNQ